LRLIAKFLRQSSARSNAAVTGRNRQACLVFSTDTGKKLIDEMNDFDHGDLSLTMNETVSLLTNKNMRIVISSQGEKSFFDWQYWRVQYIGILSIAKRCSNDC
jgi:hypothetical protein